MKTIIYPVKVHTCLLSRETILRKFLVPNEKYLSMAEGSPWYRALQLKCRCRKTITQREADQRVRDGVAEPVWKLKNSKMEIDYSIVWMAQQRQVPRVDMVTDVDIERAYVTLTGTSKADIEEIHRIFIENRKKLIVPFVEEKYIGDWPLNGKDANGDITPGRLIFPFRPDERTPGGHTA